MLDRGPTAQPIYMPESIIPRSPVVREFEDLGGDFDFLSSPQFSPGRNSTTLTLGRLPTRRRVALLKEAGYGDEAVQHILDQMERTDLSQRRALPGPFAFGRGLGEQIAETAVEAFRPGKRGTFDIMARRQLREQQRPEPSSQAEAFGRVAGGILPGLIGVTEPRTVEELGPLDVAATLPLSRPVTGGVAAFQRELRTISRGLRALPEGIGQTAQRLGPETGTFLGPKTAAVSAETEVDPLLSKVTDALRGAKTVKTMTQETFESERAARVAQAQKALAEATTVPERMAARRMARGAAIFKPELQFVEPITDQEFGALRQRIDAFEGFKYGKEDLYAKANADDALKELFINHQIPAPYEIKLLEQVFGKEFGDAARSSLSLSRNAWESTMEALNVPRTVMASYDLSYARQAAPLIPGHPLTFAKTFVPVLRALRKQEWADQLDLAMRSDEAFNGWQNAGGYFAPIRGGKLAAREESFMGQLLRRVPGVEASQRAFVIGLNKFRLDLYKQVTRGWEDTGKTASEYEALAGFLNVATGRGNLGAMQNLAPILNAGFFSPRLLISRFQTPLALFNPRIPLMSAVRVEIAKDLAAFVGTGAAVLMALDHSGLADVVADPRSSDFGRIRIGKTRIDFWGGFQPIARVTAQMMTGQRKSTDTGDIKEANYQETMVRFLRSKLGPIPGVITSLATGRTFTGEEFRPGALPQELLAPLFFRDVWDAIRESGFKAAPLVAPSFLGASAMTYTTTEGYLNEVAKEQFNAPYRDLERDQKLALFTQGPIRQELFQRSPDAKKRFETELEIEERHTQGKISTEQALNEYRQLAERYALESQAPEVLSGGSVERQALADYYETFNKARTPSGTLDSEALDSLQSALRAQWNWKERQYVDDNVKIGIHPPLFQEYINFQRQKEQIDWWHFHRSIPAFQNAPPQLVQMYEEAAFHDRAGDFRQWLNRNQTYGPPALVEQRYREGRELVDKAKLAYRQQPENWQFDLWKARFEGSLPVQSRSQAAVAALATSPDELFSVLNSGLGTRMATDDRVALGKAGITTLDQLAAASPYRLAGITKHEVSTIIKWAWVKQAQRIGQIMAEGFRKSADVGQERP